MKEKIIVFFSILILGFSLQASEDWKGLVLNEHKRLKRSSDFYRYMVNEIEKRHTLAFVSEPKVRLGNVVDVGDILNIELNPKLKRERLSSIIIWEIANAYQRGTFDELGRRVRAGKITSAKEYGLRMELVEYSSFRFHKQVLDELKKTKGSLSHDYLFFINPNLKHFSDYRLPLVHDYIDAQAKGGHTAHYEKWFYKIK